MNISLIKPYEKNAKKHPTKQIKQIARSIKEFGFNQPIVVDGAGVIIVGHGRYYAAKILGLTDVPTLELKNITQGQAQAYRLADNKLNESKWDRKLVVEELKALNIAGIDITITGFDHDMLLTQEERDDMIPSVVPAQVKHGELYQLGKHRLLCGDATKKEDVDRLMNGEKAHMVFTDPLYNVNYKGKGKKTSQGIMNDAMEENDFDTFLDAIFGNYKRILRGGAGVYVFHSTTTQAQFEAALVKNGFSIKNQLIWNKPTANLGWNDYRWKHEPIFYCGVKDGKTLFYGDRTNTTVLDVTATEDDLVKWARNQIEAEKKGLTSVWTMGRDSVSEYSHRTQKPVELITVALTNSSQAEEAVVDFFGGSGSTLIACEKANRRCYTMELDPHFCDTIIARYEEYSGTKAQKVKHDE